MLRRASALGLIAVFVALVASPWFACGGAMAEAPHDCCLVMGDGHSGAASDACCVMKEATGGGAQPETAQVAGDSTRHAVTSPVLFSNAPDLRAQTVQPGVEPAPDISPSPSRHVPLRI